MHTRQNSLENVHEHVRSQLESLMDDVRNGRADRRPFDEIYGLLQALPLSTTEYDVACRRLRNACSCHLDAEPGAANYELRLLLKSMDRQLAWYRKLQSPVNHVTVSQKSRAAAGYHKVKLPEASLVEG